MYYGNIKNYDIADGEGVRVTLFVSGCRHHCEGCFQPQTWDFDYGQPFTDATKAYIFKLLSNDLIQGFTCLGGEPFEPENQEVLAPMLKEMKEKFPDKDIWCYTGYTYDTDLMPGGSVRTEYTEDMLKAIDILVDGEFVLALKDLTLKFRGSSNQRMLHLVDGKVVKID
ncbi:MAG: anaerobic ribonucleoside-triphosphate reductase activating protein [Eubacterium sp.]|nr:anaerobic ribonucleoside-triphosphate reductase activating protein [Eubacterium sp.]